MVAWEGKPMAGMMWTALQDYFTEKWLKRKQYSAITANNLVSKKQHSMHRKQQQPRRKVRPKRCSSQCCRTSTPNKLHRWRQQTK